MHIPDGYLGPATCGFFYVAMLPIWAIASKIVKKTLKTRQVPMLAIGAAFSFVIMIFNLPLPGGSSAHGVGGVIVAILLGPWAACFAITVTLVIQALLFGDGGIIAIGANCFNMAFILPFAGYYIYRAISYKALLNSKRRIFAAGLAGYLAVTLAALFAGIELGLQSFLYHPAGAFYFPYGLKAALTAMLGGHLLVIGWVEAIMTAFVIKYLQKYSPQLFAEGRGNF